jgi:hypothetical protein
VVTAAVTTRIDIAAPIRIVRPGVPHAVERRSGSSSRWYEATARRSDPSAATARVVFEGVVTTTSAKTMAGQGQRYHE